MAEYHHRFQAQLSSAAEDTSPRRAAGMHQHQPTRIKSFFRQNQNNAARKFLSPVMYIFLAAIYFHTLLFHDVGSGVHVIRDNINENVTHASAPVWNSADPASGGGGGGSTSAESNHNHNGVVVSLQPRSLADVTIANAEVAWKRQVEQHNYLRRRAEMRELQRKKREEAYRLAKLQKEINGTLVYEYGDPGGVANGTEQAIVMTLPNATKLESETDEEYVKRLSNLSVKRTPKRRKMGQGNSGDVGFLPVLIMISTCTLFRLCVNLLIGHTASLDPHADSDGEDDDAETDNGTRTGRSGLSFLSGGREAARLRRRARVQRAHRQFQRFVDRLNAEREANGERQISADTLRHLVNARDFNGNDYDRLSSFVEENGPAMGSFFSAIGATEAEINRCPSRTIGEGDDLLRPSRQRGGQQQHCSICLEQYQVGETVRTIPCFHSFHQSCIDKWLEFRAECPICKHSAIG